MTNNNYYYTSRHWTLGFITRIWTPRLYQAMKCRYQPAQAITFPMYNSGRIKPNRKDW